MEPEIIIDEDDSDVQYITLNGCTATIRLSESYLSYVESHIRRKGNCSRMFDYLEKRFVYLVLYAANPIIAQMCLKRGWYADLSFDGNYIWRG